jgi:hypothetical protein
MERIAQAYQATRAIVKWLAGPCAAMTKVPPLVARARNFHPQSGVEHDTSHFLSSGLMTKA